MGKLEIVDERTAAQVRIDSLSAGAMFAFGADAPPMMRTSSRLVLMDEESYVSLIDGAERAMIGCTMVHPLTGTLTIK